MQNIFFNIDENIKYISPKNYLPKIGFQFIDSVEDSKSKIGDPGGFCALWSIWYIDMRLTNIYIERKKLVNHLIKKIKTNNISFKEIIRNYSFPIIEYRDEILKKSNMDINDWINDEYTDENNKLLNNNINIEIEKLNF